MPTNVAARMTLAADPGSLQGAVAAGILGAGPVVLGTAEECARLLEELRTTGRDPAEAARAELARTRAARIPGFGHPVHKPRRPARRADPRARRRARRERPARRARARFRDVARGWGRPLTMNVSMPIAAVMLDLGFPSDTVKAVPILARTAGLLAHLAEERETPVGLRLAARGRGGGRVRRRLMPRPRGRDPALGRAARARRRRLPRAARLPARALARSTARSSARRARTAADGGLAEIARLPLTEKDELKATDDAREPVGAHLCAARDEIVRIYSTSGTTGTPSYIPLTAGDLDNWVTGSARSYAASGVARRASGSSRPTTPARSSPGAALDAFDRIGLCPHPGRHRQHRAADAARSSCLRPEAVVLTPSYAAYLVEWAAERGVDLARLQRRARARRRRAGRRRAGVPRELEAGWGAQRHRGDGHRRHRPSLWGECEEQDGMHLGARGFVHAELIDPETGEALPLVRRRARASSCSRTCATAPRRSCASARATTSSCETEPVRVRPHGAARPLRRPHRRHADRPRRQRLPVGDPRGRQRRSRRASAATSSSARRRRA